MRYLEENDGIYITDLETVLGVSHAVLKTIEKNEYIKIVKESIVRNPLGNKEIISDKPKKLTNEQKLILNDLFNQSEKSSKTSSGGVVGSATGIAGGNQSNKNVGANVGASSAASIAVADNSDGSRSDNKLLDYYQNKK